MFFILSKLAILFLTPFSWFLVLVFCAFFVKKELWRKRLKWAAVAVFILFSNTFLFTELMRKWEVHGTRIENLGNYDVGIILGGMAEYNSDLDVLTIGRHADRMWQAITLYKKGKIKKFLISGDTGFITDRGLHEAEQMKAVLVGWDIPETDILIEGLSKNTHENAVETKRFLEASYPHLEKRLLITSGVHMRRASACFKKVDLPCDTFSTDLFTGPHRNLYWDQYIIPDQGTFGSWSKLIKEWIGYMVYDVIGYI
jgi:uncharacterized SAM-binding protein YcdF (DUF218 family)